MSLADYFHSRNIRYMRTPPEFSFSQSPAGFEVASFVFYRTRTQ